MKAHRHGEVESRIGILEKETIFLLNLTILRSSDRYLKSEKKKNNNTEVTGEINRNRQFCVVSNANNNSRATDGRGQ